MSALQKYEMVDVGILHIRDAEDELMYADGPDGKPDESKPMRIHLYGPGSKQQAKAQTRYKNSLVAKMARKGGKVKLTADEERELDAQFLADVTKQFDNMGDLVPAGQDLAGEDLYLAVYGNQKLTFIPQQAQLYARDTSNFKPAPSKS